MSRAMNVPVLPAPALQRIYLANKMLHKIIENNVRQSYSGHFVKPYDNNYYKPPFSAIETKQNTIRGY